MTSDDAPLPTVDTGERFLVDRYRIGRLLGRGGMGAVWAARDELLDRDVAVKEVLPPAALTSAQWEEITQRTLREARAAARITHPSVVRVYDVVQDGGHPWIVMELLDSRSLADALSADGSLTPPAAARVGLQVADALRMAHRAGVLHRDIKPANVMLSETGRTVLTDFGIATFEQEPTLTATGMLVGSPGYMSPERARGERPTAASDLWSLGATLFAAVEGAPPFQRDGQLQTLHAVAHEAPPAAASAGPLAPLIARLLDRDPSRRPDAQAAYELLREVNQAIARLGPDDSDTQPVRTSPSDFPTLVETRRQVPAILPPTGSEAVSPAADDEPPRTQSQTASVPQSTTESETESETESATMQEAEPATVPAVKPAVKAPIRLPAEPRADPLDTPVTGPVDQPVRAPTPAPSGRGGRGRRTGIALALAAGLIVVATAAALLSLRPDAGTVQVRGGAPATSSSSATGSTASPGNGAAPVPSATGSTPTQLSGTDGAADKADHTPAGFRLRRDPTGFSVAVPKAWTRSVRGSSTFFSDPAGPSYLQVDQTRHPKADALQDWQAQEASASTRFTGYQRIRLRRIAYRGWNAADWEFTWQPSSGRLHVLNRNVRVSDHRAYALLWSVPAAQWDDRRSDFEVVTRTFEPAA